MQASSHSFGLRLLIALAAFVIVVAGMKAAEAILVPFLLSAFIAIISAPSLFWLEQKKVPATLAVMIMISGIIIILGLISLLIGTSIQDFTQQLPQYQARLKDETSAIIAWLSGKGLNLSHLQVQELIDPGKVMNLVSNMLTGLGGVLTNSFLIFFTVIFIMMEASSFPHKLQAIYGNKPTPDYFQAFLGKVKNYMAIKTALSFLTGFIVAIGLALIGVDYALLWGLLAFLLNFVPNIGSILAAIPAVLLAFIQLGTLHAILAIALYMIVNFVIDNILAPRFMGRGLGLSTLVVFLSLIFWGWVLGPVGMLLSVPLTITAKIALASHEDTQWIAILLDSGDEQKIAENR